MSARVEAWIGLGSNLDEPVRQVHRALEALAALPGGRLVRRSPLYGSAPMGPAEQPDYVNAVAALETALAPHALLDALQAIEAAAGRTRGPEQWGPRTLDLDLLLYGDCRIADERLVVPHPGVGERPFVLVPLAAAAPGLMLPDGTRVDERAAAVAPDEVWVLEDGEAVS